MNGGSIIAYIGSTQNIITKKVDINDKKAYFLSHKVPIIANGTGTANAKIASIGTYTDIKTNIIPNVTIIAACDSPNFLFN